MNSGIAYLTELVNIKTTKILQKNVEKLWILCIAFSVRHIDTLLNKISYWERPRSLCPSNTKPMIDLYDLLTPEELETVSQIALEAMTRDGLTPNVWELHISAEL